MFTSPEGGIPALGRFVLRVCSKSEVVTELETLGLRPFRTRPWPCLLVLCVSLFVAGPLDVSETRMPNDVVRG